MTLGTIKRAMVITAVVTASAAASAGAATLTTAPIQPAAGEKLVCTVVNVKGKRLGITAEIIDRWGVNVTNFVRTDWDASETVLLTVHSEATNADARYCRVTVTGGRKSDVRASLQACSYDENVCGSPLPAR